MKKYGIDVPPIPVTPKSAKNYLFLENLSGAAFSNVPDVIRGMKTPESGRSGGRWALPVAHMRWTLGNPGYFFVRPDVGLPDAPVVFRDFERSAGSRYDDTTGETAVESSYGTDESGFGEWIAGYYGTPLDRFMYVAGMDRLGFPSATRYESDSGSDSGPAYVARRVGTDRSDSLTDCWADIHEWLLSMRRTVSAAYGTELGDLPDDDAGWVDRSYGNAGPPLPPGSYDREMFDLTGDVYVTDDLTVPLSEIDVRIEGMLGRPARSPGAPGRPLWGEDLAWAVEAYLERTERGYGTPSVSKYGLRERGMRGVCWIHDPESSDSSSAGEPPDDPSESWPDPDDGFESLDDSGSYDVDPSDGCLMRTCRTRDVDDDETCARRERYGGYNYPAGETFAWASRNGYAAFTVSWSETRYCSGSGYYDDRYALDECPLATAPADATLYFRIPFFSLRHLVRTRGWGLGRILSSYRVYCVAEGYSGRTESSCSAGGTSQGGCYGDSSFSSHDVLVRVLVPVHASLGLVMAGSTPYVAARVAVPGKALMGLFPDVGRPSAPVPPSPQSQGDTSAAHAEYDFRGGVAGPSSYVLVADWRFNADRA